MVFAKRHIRVTLIDADTGEPIVETSAPPTELPDKFEGYTTLKVGDATWEVTVAEPTLRREYLQTGTLRLQVRKVETVVIPVSELLYSLPTIADAIPEVDLEVTKTGLNVLEIVEDDWCQIEILSGRTIDQITQCMRKIEEVFDESRNAAGYFTKLHVRREVNQPFASRVLKIETIAKELQKSDKVDSENRMTAGPADFQGLSYRNLGGVIKNGFAMRTAQGLYIYGTTDGVYVSQLGLLRCRTAVPPKQDARSLARLMNKHGLILVDWCRRAVISGTDAADYICNNVSYQVE